MTLEELCAQALLRDGATQAVEYRDQPISWESMRRVADRVGSLVEASGASKDSLVALIPRNRPSAMAALLGLIAKGYSVRMVYAYLSSTALARELERIKPAVIVAAEEDINAEVQRTLQTQGTAVIGLTEMDAKSVRADGAIVRGGFKLLPETIERALMLHESVAAAGVLGLHDQRLGQVPAAAVQLKPDVEPLGVAELEAHLRGHVYSTHIPVTWRFVEELPRTPSLKVDRLALQALFATPP
jgi:acyl-coenzyme A synthetase/AMP-(fatty) acid ligase